VHRGETIDRQTHLGFDLASLRAAPVEAAQNGIVVLADMLGIYGNTVIVDHGLGVFTLYGHLSTFAVKVGDRVSKGQTIGQTGDTGLAGGDHLHFSVMLHGVHIDPVEWWDPKWIEDHLTENLKMFPAARQAKGDGAAPAAPEGGDAQARP
jgi:murein DD-endopeptidase MepM/ murein hydrolase activator NlpD